MVPLWVDVSRLERFGLITTCSPGENPTQVDGYLPSVAQPEQKGKNKGQSKCTDPTVALASCVKLQAPHSFLEGSQPTTATG